MQEQETQILKRTQQLLDTIKDSDDAYQSRELRDFKRMKFETDEEFNEHLSNLKEHLASQKQAGVNASIGNGRVPRGIRTDDQKQASDQLITDVLNKIM